MYASALAASTADATSIRSRHEVAGELFKLYAVSNRAPGLSAFGDNNRDAIRAQIRVLREQMTLEEVVERFEDEDDYVLSAALEAAEWLRGDAPALSQGWQRIAA